MKPLRYIIMYVSALLAMQSVGAQSVAPTVTSHLSADTIMIGDRVTFTIDVEKAKSQNVHFPQFKFANTGQEVSSVEVISDFPIESEPMEEDRELLHKRYEMIIYDEGVYNFGDVHVLYDVDENRVDTLFGDTEKSVVVETFQIDTTEVKAVRALKPQKDLEFRFEEISDYVYISIGSSLLLALLILLLIRYLRKRGKRLSDLFKSAPPVPAHIVALKALKELHDKELWQNDQHKLYYSELSDILRSYIAGRFGIGAMEMTTDEIVGALREVEMEQKSKMELLSVLRDADLVKFAKEVPVAEENIGAYDKALHFVESTKPVEEVKVLEDKPTKNKRRTK